MRLERGSQTEILGSSFLLTVWLLVAVTFVVLFRETYRFVSVRWPTAACSAASISSTRVCRRRMYPYSHLCQLRFFSNREEPTSVNCWKYLSESESCLAVVLWKNNEVLHTVNVVLPQFFHLPLDFLKEQKTTGVTLPGHGKISPLNYFLCILSR